MGVLSRINDIVRSNLNELVSKAENPEKLLNQSILDMEAHLRKARKQAIDTIAAEKTMEKKRLSVMATAGQWERRAAMALQAGDEDLARRAIVRKNEFEASAQNLEEQIRVQREYVGALKQSLVSLEERHREAKVSKQALITRAHAAQARKKTVEKLGGGRSPRSTPESRAFDTFDRMEDRVLAIEAQVEAYTEMSAEQHPGKEEAALDAKFASLESSQKIEEQLAALKQEIDGQTKAESSP